MPVTTPTEYPRSRDRIRSEPISKLAVSVAFCWCFAASVAVAEKPENFPGSPVDSKTMRIQEMVNELFEQGEYERALFIYENELAPIGDKYAQYMIGYMYLTGAGVAEDSVIASAWYRLAAERSNSPFVKVRDQLVGGLSEFDRGRSDEVYLQLRQQYSDVVILLRLIREDMEVVALRTGSRIPGPAGSDTVYDLRLAPGDSGKEYFRRIQLRNKNRLEFLTRELDLSDSELDVDDLNINTLDALVERHITTIDDSRSFSVDR